MTEGDDSHGAEQDYAHRDDHAPPRVELHERHDGQPRGQPDPSGTGVSEIHRAGDGRHQSGECQLLKSCNTRPQKPGRPKARGEHEAQAGRIQCRPSRAAKVRTQRWVSDIPGEHGPPLMKDFRITGQGEIAAEARENPQRFHPRSLNWRRRPSDEVDERGNPKRSDQPPPRPHGRTAEVGPRGQGAADRKVGERRNEQPIETSENRQLRSANAPVPRERRQQPNQQQPVHGDRNCPDVWTPQRRP